MDEYKLYKLLVAEDSFDHSIQAIEKNTSNECLRLSLTAIMQCRRRKYDEARKLVSEIDGNTCDIFPKSTYMEAKMLILLYDKTDFDKVEELADYALSINPKAAYARVIKGQIAFNRGNTKSGTGYMLSVLEDYPNAKWIYYTLVRMLAFAKEYKSAQKYIENIEPTFRRILYYTLVKIVLPLPNKFFWGLVFLILFGVGNTSIIFLIFMIPLLMIIIYSMVKKDNFIYSGFISTSIIIFVLFILISALK